MMREIGYRRYLLTVLLIVYAFNATDRLALGLVLQDIKLDLSLTDTQLGVLTGIAFALFYSLMGIPISRWADRGNRVAIISIATVLWSAAVCSSGLAASFVQLLLIRVCVAVGEAGCLPASVSLIGDYFSRSERPRAVAIYLQGGVLSVVIGYFLGGWLNELYGWRSTFIVLGLPGLVLGPLAWFTLREPRRTVLAERGNADFRTGAQAGDAARVELTPGLREVYKILRANRTFRHLLLFYALTFFFNMGIAQWQPAFFVRTYGLKTGELGTWIAVIGGLGALLGTWLGGEWAFRWAANNERLQLKTMAVTYSSVGVFSALIYLAPSRYWAFGLMLLWSVAGTMTSGPVIATIQTLVPQRMRATTISVTYLFANLIGMGLGPLAVGGLSDVLRHWTGENSLRYTLLMLSPGYVWAGWSLWRASGTVTDDLAATELELEAEAPPGATAPATGMSLAH
jgi:MFS family permease